MFDDALPGGLDSFGGADPAHYGFIPDTREHDIVAGQVAFMAPQYGRIPLREVAALGNAGIDADQIPNVSFADEFDDGAVELQGMRGRNDLGYEVGSHA